MNNTLCVLFLSALRIVIFCNFIYYGDTLPIQETRNDILNAFMVPFGAYGGGPNIDEEGALFEGDIAGHDFELNVQERNVIRNLTKRWPNGVVPYVFDPDKFSSENIAVVMNAFADFKKETCVRFETRTVETEYLVIVAERGCWSFVGREGGPQKLSLEIPGCVHKGIVIHELMHALGVWHEQSRHDRDNFIEINYDNISPDHHHNFRKVHENASQTFGLDYDYDSIMHYSAYSFALNRSLPTIVPKIQSQSVQIGQRKGLSASDIRKINHLYECQSNTTTVVGSSSRSTYF